LPSDSKAIVSRRRETDLFGGFKRIDLWRAGGHRGYRHKIIALMREEQVRLLLEFCLGL
jgi:hypothetical protein